MVKLYGLLLYQILRGVDLAISWDTFSTVWSYIAKTIGILDVIFAIIIVFFERKNPKSVWAWLLLLMAVPILGFVVYILGGQMLNKRRMFKGKMPEKALEEALYKQAQEFEHTDPDSLPQELVGYSGLVRYNMVSDLSLLTDDNDITIFTDGRSKFEALKDDLEKAEKFIDLQYYIIRRDELFEEIAGILEKKAAEGVEVRILADGVGSRSTPKRYWKKLRGKGIKTAVFWPDGFARINFHVNYRNHRKIAVIDNRVAYVGGFNIGREYIDMEPKRFGHWRDTHMRIEGGAAMMLSGRFALDWAYVTGEKLFDRSDMFGQKEIDNKEIDNKEIENKKTGNRENSNKETENRAIENIETGITEIEKDVAIPDSKHGSYVQVLSSGPDDEKQQIRDNYLYLISKAKKSIYIQTPYLSPDDTILEALKLAARSGVDVRVMIPCKPDHPFVYWCTHSFAGELVMAGVTVYKYNGGFLHAKGMIADDEVFCYGTANMDIRSFALNFEVNAMVYDRKKAEEMSAVFMEDVEKCELMSPEEYGKRKLWVRFKEQLFRLMAPVL